VASEDYKLQVSYKVGSAGDMINVRANTADELSVLLEGIGDYSSQIASVRGLLQGAYNTIPLVISGSTPDTRPSTSSAPTPPPQADSLVAPTCVHGPRKLLQGISKKNGKPYKMWVCTMPQGPEQCQPAN
jgi:hypothetical protein